MWERRKENKDKPKQQELCLVCHAALTWPSRLTGMPLKVNCSETCKQSSRQTRGNGPEWLCKLTTPELHRAKATEPVWEGLGISLTPAPLKKQASKSRIAAYGWSVRLNVSAVSRAVLQWLALDASLGSLSLLNHIRSTTVQTCTQTAFVIWGIPSAVT